MSFTNPLKTRLDANEIIIMDGGTGTEIQFRGIPMESGTWSGAPMLTNPELVRDIHENYLRVGAEVIITNTFSTSRARLSLGGLGDRTREANFLGVRLAKEAVERVGSKKKVTIAGSMSTFVPADPMVTPSYEAALTDYREQAKYLAEAGVDVIVAEMIIRILDARAAVQAAIETGLPVWVGYSTIKSQGRQVLGLHGKSANEEIKEAVKAVEPMGVSMFYSMHSSPEDTGPALSEMKSVTGLPLGAYAHTVKNISVASAKPNDEKISEILKQNPSTDEYLQFCSRWVEVGAQVIGGCCGVTPDHIRAIKEGLPGKILA